VTTTISSSEFTPDGPVATDSEGFAIPAPPARLSSKRKSSEEDMTSLASQAKRQDGGSGSLAKSVEVLSSSVSHVDLGSLATKEYNSDETGGPTLVRERTKLEREVLARHDAAQQLIDHLGGTGDDPASVYFPSMLRGALFCGHLVTDMDSIAGAIGAADLYGGVACRASEVNSETAFCLEHWGVAKPPPIEELLESQPDAGVCLVDHQQTSQVNPAIPLKRIGKQRRSSNSSSSSSSSSRSDEWRSRHEDPASYHQLQVAKTKQKLVVSPPALPPSF
jgi:hypothetical protein